MEWQPIEAAPKDGTHVLVCDSCPNHPPAYPLMVANAAWWGDRWVVYMDAVQDPDLHFDPTHWMPLPPPPSKEQA